ncbi:hypothetical protein FNF28_03130 [Cafeteria roenbergensis]|uniref:Uncharacterized protein n=1 Tax=Cafeteria roenbergensis TaxID=33653 RepID=A0A5A8DMW1_CAFRO|nr:hypothetical protein FNF28_03130 [Cafeteria roenbergensis]
MAGDARSSVRELLEPKIDRRGVLGDAVWWRIAPHLTEWTCAGYDSSGQFLAAISATGYVGLWDTVSIDAGYDLLQPSDWPSSDQSGGASTPLDAAARAAETAAAARIAKDLYSSADRAGSAVRAAAKRTAVAWGYGSRVLYAAMGHVVLAIDVSTQAVIASATSSGSKEERPAGDAAEAPLAPPSLQVVLTRGGSGRREAGLVVSSQDCSAVSLTGRNEAYVVTAADIQEAIEEDAEEEASAEHDEELDTGNSTPAAAGQVATAGAAAPLGRLPNASDGAPTSSSSSSSSSMTSSSHSARLPLLKAASSAGLAAAAAGDADGETDTPRTSERGGGGRVSRLSAAASLTEEPAYREPVDSTRLDASHLSADGHILFCVPSRDAGLGRGKLLAFQRGVAGGISSIVPPRAATGDIIQVTSRAFPPALAVVTSGGGSRG